MLTGRVRRVAWASSTADPRITAAFDAVVDAIASGELDVALAGVVLAPRPGYPPPDALEAAAGAAGVPVVGPDGVDALAVDLVLMVGYAWIVDADAQGRTRWVNVHPALPDGPIGREGEVLDALVADGATQSGLTAHGATAALDRGPVVSFARFEVDPPPGWPPRAHLRRALAAATGRHLPAFVVATLALLAVDPAPVGPVDLTASVAGGRR